MKNTEILNFYDQRVGVYSFKRITNGLHMKTKCFNYKVALNRIGSFFIVTFLWQVKNFRNLLRCKAA